MNKDNKRYYKQFKKRASKLAAERVESLGAAFLKETGLKAANSMLCSRTIERDGVPQFELWYAERPADVDLNQAHPDVAFMADVVQTLVSGSRNPDQQVFLKLCLSLADLSKDVMTKYEKQTTTMTTDVDHPISTENAAAANQQAPELE